jgi:hypothetical protein
MSLRVPIQILRSMNDNIKVFCVKIVALLQSNHLNKQIYLFSARLTFRTVELKTNFYTSAVFEEPQVIHHWSCLPYSIINGGNLIKKSQ